MLGVDVYHGGLALVENAQLAGEIILKGGVLDARDMVAPDIEKDAKGKRHAEHAIVLQPLARDLHDHVAPAGFHGVPQMPPELGGLGSGVVALVVLDAVVGFDGTKYRWGLAGCE